MSGSDDGQSIEQISARRKSGRKELTATEREERDLSIIRDRLRGQSWQHIGQKYDLAVRLCKEIYERWRKENPQTWKGRDPTDIVEEMLERLEAWTEHLADIADTTRTDLTRIAAINAQADKMTRAAELMQATNILPHNLATLRVEHDVRILAQHLVTVLVEHNAPRELKQAILAELRPGAHADAA
jgi:hypothetical protein